MMTAEVSTFFSGQFGLSVSILLTDTGTPFGADKTIEFELKKMESKIEALSEEDFDKLFESLSFRYLAFLDSYETYREEMFT